MKAKILKGFFEEIKVVSAQSHMPPQYRSFVHVAEDTLPPELREPGKVWVETCPQYSGTFGFVCSAGYVDPASLNPLRNIKVNRERIRRWAAAKRRGIEQSAQWYAIYKGVELV